jgi:hypothetical protein
MKKKNEVIIATFALLLLIIAVSFIILSQSPRLDVVFATAEEGQHLIIGFNDVEYTYNVTAYGTYTTLSSFKNLIDLLHPLQQKYDLCTQVEVNRSNTNEHYFSQNHLKFQLSSISDNTYHFKVWSNSTLPQNEISSLALDIQKALTSSIGINK